MKDKELTYGIIFNSPNMQPPNPKIFKKDTRLPMYLNWIHEWDDVIACDQAELIKGIKKAFSPTNSIEKLTIKNTTLSFCGFTKNTRHWKYSADIPINNPNNTNITLKLSIRTFVRGIISIRPKEWQKTCISLVELDDTYIGLCVISPQHSFGMITEKIK